MSEDSIETHLRALFPGYNVGAIPQKAYNYALRHSLGLLDFNMPSNKIADMKKQIETISEKDIDKHYKQAARKTHPDKGGDQEEFKKVKHAHGFLIAYKNKSKLKEEKMPRKAKSSETPSAVPVAEPKLPKAKKEKVMKAAKVIIEHMEEPEPKKEKKSVGSASSRVMNLRKKKAEAGASVQSMMDSARVGATMSNMPEVSPIIAEAVKKERKARKSSIPIPIEIPEAIKEEKPKRSRKKAEPKPIVQPKPKRISREEKRERAKMEKDKEREGMAYKEIESAEFKIKSMFDRELAKLGHGRSKINFRKLEHDIGKAIRCVSRATKEEAAPGVIKVSKPKRAAGSWAQFVKEKGGVKAATAAKAEYQNRKQNV